MRSQIKTSTPYWYQAVRAVRNTRNWFPNEGKPVSFYVKRMEQKLFLTSTKESATINSVHLKAYEIGGIPSMRTIIWFIYFWLYLLVMIPYMNRAKKLAAEGKKEEHDTLVRTCVDRWANRLMRLAGVDITVTGKENIPDGTVVYVANHQGYFDIPLMLTQLAQPGPILAKKQIEKLPFIRDWMGELHCIFIDRDDPRQSMDCLKQAQKLLSEGYSVVIFPEGTRNYGGELKEFKAGAIRVATKGKVPIVPVCIDGSYTIMEKNNMWIHPGKVKITIMPSIPTETMSKEEVRALPDQLREMLASQLAKTNQLIEK